MAVKKYLDIDLSIEDTGDGYRLSVSSLTGQASRAFHIPFSQAELESSLLRMGTARLTTNRGEGQMVEAMKEMGGRLFRALFGAGNDIQAVLRGTLNAAVSHNAGLRFRLRCDAPELVRLPWEILYNPAINRFLSLSADMPLVRFQEQPERARPLVARPPLRILVMISSPIDDNYEPVDVEKEWDRLQRALKELQRQKLVIVDQLEEASLSMLLRHLRKFEYHIFHYIGHGVFDEPRGGGALVLENEAKGVELTGAADLGAVLRGHDSMRLAVLNACEGRHASARDPFASLARGLLCQPPPAVLSAVIAMQFALTGEGSQVFGPEFYGAVARGLPADSALTETRKALFAARKTFEWAAPVLWSRSPDCKLFDLPIQTGQATSGARRAYANLFVRQGEQVGQNFPLMAETYLIGRDERLSISVQDVQVSRTHAQIIYNSLGFWIEDLNSRNGTFVNGIRITGKAPLHNGDVIRVGGTTLVFDQEFRPGAPIKLHPALAEDESLNEGEDEERNNVMALWAEMQTARQQKDWETAIARGEAILALDPTHSKARSGLAAVQKEQKIAQLYAEAQAAQAGKDWDTVIPRLQSILNLEPGEILVRHELHEAHQKRKAASLYLEAQKALAENNQPLATARLLAVLAIEPTHPQATDDLVRIQQTKP